MLSYFAYLARIKAKFCSYFTHTPVASGNESIVLGDQVIDRITRSKARPKPAFKNHQVMHYVPKEGVEFVVDGFVQRKGKSPIYRLRDVNSGVAVLLTKDLVGLLFEQKK